MGSMQTTTDKAASPSQPEVFMGFFKELMAKQEERRRVVDQRRMAEEYEEDRADWEEELESARSDLAVAEASAEDFDSAGDAPILLKKGEFPILVVTSIGLVEMGREGGSYQGVSQGVSFRVAKGVSYRVGGHKGKFVPGPELLKMVDEGMAVVTNQRVVFQGAGKTREWLFTKLIGIDHDPERGMSMLHVSNRQKASGLAYGEEISDAFRLRMDVALAHFTDDLEGLRIVLKERVAELEAEEPPPPIVTEPPPDL
jgi:hypothetical protein